MLSRVSGVNYEVHMPDKRKRKAIYHTNMLKKWHSLVDTCFWMAENEKSIEEDDIPSWKGECMW